MLCPALVIVINVESVIFCERPSTATRKLWVRLSTFSSMRLSSRMTMGRMLRLWGATGVIQIELDCGTMMGPPFESD